MRDNSNVALLVEEYTTTAREAKMNSDSQAKEDQQIIGKLVAEGEWTRKAAKHLVRLAHENGIFMLRNALALAIDMEQEDGTLSYWPCFPRGNGALLTVAARLALPDQCSGRVYPAEITYWVIPHE